MNVATGNTVHPVQAVSPSITDEACMQILACRSCAPLRQTYLSLPQTYSEVETHKRTSENA